MKLNLWQKRKEPLRNFFRRKSKVSLEKIVDKPVRREEYQSPGLAKESPYVRQVRCLLLADKKTNNPSLKNRHPEIRKVRIGNFAEAFVYFLHFCDQRLLIYRNTGSHLYCSAVFPDGSGKLSFTDKVKGRHKAVIAILKLEIEGLQPQIQEIQFEIKQ